MFHDISRSLLDDPDFKEDSVRELIITPLLSRLGYSHVGPERVIRSKSLTHPFIYAGTRKCPITLIPDYTLLNDATALLVLDAKRPTEDILSKKNVEQVYSYAIHPEIKCQHFALCNGKSLAVFHVDNSTPLLVVSFDDYGSQWDEIERYLAPRFLKHPSLRNFSPDFGLALKRFGFAERAEISMNTVRLDFLARLSDDLMTATSNCIFADREHCATFDFHRALLPEILAGLPSPVAAKFRDALSRYPFKTAADLTIEIDIVTSLGSETRGRDETFIPLIIEKVGASRFNHTTLPA